MKKIDEIKKLFASLEKEEQIELLKELSSNSETSISIADFGIKHQKKYGSNIEFSISQEGPDHCPTITATIETAYGSFSGRGSNQKIAKAKAVEEADKAWR